MATPHFHRLNIREIRRESPDAISVAFAVPDELRDTYRFTPGQFLTLRTEFEGSEVRRSYSICCGADDYERRGELRVAIKRVDGGTFSSWANEVLAEGAAIDVMPPDGRFFARLLTPLAPEHARHYAAFAAGSGITPVLSIIKTVLLREPQSRFTLVYGNRRVESILFSEELEDLKDRYLDRFTLYHVLSREHQEVDLFNGRIDGARVVAFLDTLLPAASIDEAFVCGPESMIDDVERALAEAGLDRQKIHAERFGPQRARTARAPAREAAAETAGTAEVVIVADGMRRRLRVPFEGAAILDTALAAGADLPYACKAGVCCTCRAKVLEGEVRMDRNFTLEDHEIRQGYVLTCQSHPVSKRVVVSYDER